MSDIKHTLENGVSLETLLATVNNLATALIASNAPRAPRGAKSGAASAPATEFDRVCVAANIRKGNRKEVLRAIIPNGVGVYSFDVIGKAAELQSHEVLQAVEYIGNRFAEDTCNAGYLLTVAIDANGAKFAVLREKTFAPLLAPEAAPAPVAEAAPVAPAPEAAPAPVAPEAAPEAAPRRSRR